MLFKEANDRARLLKIGDTVDAYSTPESLPISLGAYIIVPGYISTDFEKSNDLELKSCLLYTSPSPRD